MPWELALAIQWDWMVTQLAACCAGLNDNIGRASRCIAVTSHFEAHFLRPAFWVFFSAEKRPGKRATQIPKRSNHNHQGSSCQV